jgi:hypothetical protein
MKRLLFLSALLFLLPALSFAATITFTDPSSVDHREVIVLSDAPVYYSELEGFPHTYILNLTDATYVGAHVLVPDIEESKNNMSGLIVERVERGRVREVARLRPAEALWEEYFDSTTRDTYRRGSSYGASLEPGEYIVEVSTPDNYGKYVLALSAEPELDLGGYIKGVATIARIKEFFGKSQLSILSAPFLGGGAIVLIGMLVFVMRRKHVTSRSGVTHSQIEL